MKFPITLNIKAPNFLHNITRRLSRIGSTEIITRIGGHTRGFWALRC